MAPNIPAWLLRISCLCTAIGCFSFSRAQERMTHYHEQNGLLSDLAYSGLFDRNNYLWICTERGLSRFNGTSFTHFTIREGLPDNDIIYVKEDEGGVIWASPFQREVAFLEPGKTLFTNINEIIDPDTVKSDGAYEIFRLKDSSVALVAQQKKIRLVRNKHWLRSYHLPRGIFGNNSVLFQNEDGDLVLFGTRKTGLLHPSGAVDILPQPFPYERQELEGPLLWLKSKDNFLTCIDTRKGKAGTVVSRTSLPGAMFRFGFWGDTILLGTTNRKLITVNRHSGSIAPESKQVYLSTAAESRDKRVRVMFTNDEGIFVLVKTDTGRYHELPAAPACLFLDGDKVQVLDAQNRWLYPKSLKGRLTPDYDKLLPPEFAETMGKQIWVYGSDVHVIENGAIVRKIDTINSVKDVYCYNDSIRYVATGVGIFEINRYRHTWRRLLDKRGTSICGSGASVFIGNYHGLLQLLPDSTLVDWGHRGFPDIKVTDLVYKDGVLWIATGGEGLWAIRNKVVYQVADESSGLVSNAIEAIEADGRQHLVLGYATGVQRLWYQLPQDNIRIAELLTLHTVRGEGIKYLHYASGKIYGLGSRGLLILPEELREPVKNFPLQIDRVIIDGIAKEWRDLYSLPTGTHDFSLSFSTVNYEQFPVRYRYRINEGVWSSTSEPAISYHNLGPGDYRIEIQVLNNYGKPSGIQLLQVNILYPFYLRTGFILAGAGLFLALLIIFIRLWYRYRYRKANNHLLQETKLRELELAALKAQINPHFVFNCLNSIKALIYQHQLEEADWYMDHFARLFRNTLEGAAMPYHSLSQEIDYIRAYLALEQINVNNRFAFSIEVEAAATADVLMLPPMLLQPYVENAVKHGVSRLRDRKGEIKILFQQQAEELICTIADNGTGRGVAHLVADKSGKGLTITERRASLYRIKTEIRDNIPYGTVVRLILSLKTQHQTKPYDNGIYS